MKAFFADENQIKRDAIAVRQLDAPSAAGFSKKRQDPLRQVGYSGSLVR
jgi:hypothetical protein